MTDLSPFLKKDELYFVAVNHYSSPIQTIKTTPKSEEFGLWREYRHPGGSLYFCRATETPFQRVLTRVNLADPDSSDSVRKSIEDALDLIMSKERALGRALPSNIDLVLEKIDTITWGYYFADHETRTISWLVNYAYTSRVAPKIHVQYWEHWCQFPDMSDVTWDIIEELRGLALYASAEYIMTPTFKHLLYPQELEKILNLLDHIEKPCLTSSKYLAATVGRFMKAFATQQFFDRFIDNKPVPPSRNYMLRELDRIIIDKRVTDNNWVSFVDKCRSQWRELTLTATVFLTTNIAFLAIPLIGSGQGLNSVAQVASYISIVASIGTLIIGPILITRETHTAAPRTTLTRMRSVAIVYALPHGLLLWSLLSFLVAFLSMTLMGTSTVTRIFVCLACLVFFTPIVLSVVWSIRVRSFQE